jgi:hypothetical protein
MAKLNRQLFKCTFSLLVLFLIAGKSSAQEGTDTIFHTLPHHLETDTILRITNLNPYITLHVDSMLSYKLNINKSENEYYWFMKNAPVGLKISEEGGLLSFKAEKKYFLSGRLKYDEPYKVSVGVQNLKDPFERVDTTFTLLFYSTEINVSRIKPTVGSVLTVEEGDSVSFQLQCENGSFPVENITFFSSYPIKTSTPLKNCDDYFSWSPSFDIVRDSDSGKIKIIMLYFVGTTKFKARDTATVKLIVKDALNYPQMQQEHAMVTRNLNTYLLQLKYLFLKVDKKVKVNKSTRTTFDLTSASTAMTGALLATSNSSGAQNTGKVLPSVGVSLVPVKEAVAPNKVYDQNQATLIRTSIKRLDYVVRDNELVGKRDPDIVRKTNKIKEELKQTQVQLIEIPLEIVDNISEEELNQYFNSPRVNKKYRLKK